MARLRSIDFCAMQAYDAYDIRKNRTSLSGLCNNVMNCAHFHIALFVLISQTFVTCQYEPYMETFHETFVASVAQGVEAASPDGKRSWGPQIIMVFISIQKAGMFELELRSNCARISSNATSSTLCVFFCGFKFLHYSLYLQRKDTLVMERKSVIF